MTPPSWLPSRFEDGKWALDTEDELPEESEFSSGVEADGDSEIDSPIVGASTRVLPTAFLTNDEIRSLLTAPDASTSGDQNGESLLTSPFCHNSLFK